MKVMIYGQANVDGQDASLATDFYWEGASILKTAAAMVRKEAPKLGCSCTIF